ncbi:MAG: competence/damage-inducible protein A [Gemmatimonadota bacterium]
MADVALPLSPRTAALLVVGDEVLSGDVPDENTPYLTRRLWELGIQTERIVVLPDRLDEIVAEIRALVARHDYLFVTGGIGPTHDDVTRAAVATALGRPLERHAGAAATLADDYGAGITRAETAMAELPQGADLLRGSRQVAFGFRVGSVFVFPGVPGLMADIFETTAEQLLSSPFFKRTVWVGGKEGDFSETLAAIQGTHTSVAIGSYPVFVAGRYRVKLIVRARDLAALDAAVAAIETELRLAEPPAEA